MNNYDIYINNKNSLMSYLLGRVSIIIITCKTSEFRQIFIFISNWKKWINCKHLIWQVQAKFLSSNSFFFLNVINSFEDGNGNVVVDIIGYDSADVLDQVFQEFIFCLKIEKNQKTFLGITIRWRSPLGLWNLQIRLN